MERFDTIIIVDWSARSTPSPERPSKDAIWIGIAGSDGIATLYRSTRAAAVAALSGRLRTELAVGRRVLLGFDFSFGYPAGFATRLVGTEDALALWAGLATRIEDDEHNRNNRYETAARLNRLYGTVGPFWGRPAGLALPDLPPTKSFRYDDDAPERRQVELRVRSAKSCWQLCYNGCVGSQALLGLPWLHRLRTELPIAVWPFERPAGPIVLAEIYPSLLARDVDAVAASSGVAIKDQVQVALLAAAIAHLDAVGGLQDAFRAGSDAPPAEGWILGVGVEGALRAAARAVRPAVERALERPPQ